MWSNKNRFLLSKMIKEKSVIKIYNLILLKALNDSVNFLNLIGKDNFVKVTKF